MKVKVEKKHRAAKRIKSDLNKHVIVALPEEIAQYDSVSINVELKRNETIETATSAKEISSSQNDADWRRPNIIKQLCKVITTKAKDMATEKQDGALVVRSTAATIMHAAAWFGYIFSLTFPLFVIYNHAQQFNQLDLDFIITCGLSFLLSAMLSIFIFIISKGLRVDAFKLEQNEDVSQVYNIAALVATILMAVLSQK